MKTCFTVMLIVSLVVLSSCDMTDPVSNSAGINETSLAPPAYTEDQINQLILAEASKQLGRVLDSTSGQCKVWVQNVVSISTGRTVPMTDTSDPAAPYYRAQWIPNADTRIIWQLNPSYCIGQFPSSLKPGQAIQLRWRADIPWPNCKNGPHTVIIKTITASTIEMYDSNFVASYTVGKHSFSVRQWGTYVAAWTTYQIK